MKLNGWSHIGGAVYEHADGCRVHLGGLCRLPSGDFISANGWPEYKNMTRMIAINGGNRKRGLLAWAITKARGIK